MLFDLIPVVILATTDLHAQLMPYSYLADTQNENFGMSRISTLVNEQRRLHPEAFLVDNGDFLDGSLLGDRFGKGEAIWSSLPLNGVLPMGKRVPIHPIEDAFLTLRSMALG